MYVNTDVLVPMTEANQNFSKVVRLVDEEGIAVIMKNNKPRYIVVEFAEYDDIQNAREARRSRIASVGDKVISENMAAFVELAK